MKLSVTSDEVRKNALHAIASSLSDRKDEIKRENAIDIENARKNGISDSILHRLVFTDEKIASAIKGLEELALLPDPIGKVREKRELDPGFILEKRTFPIGVIAMIFEARPDALVQIAGLSLRSGNAVVLKGGKEAQRSNAILTKIIKEATEPIVGAHWILGIESHEDVNTLLTLEDYMQGQEEYIRQIINLPSKFTPIARKNDYLACPACGTGKLYPHDGKFGKFWSCSNYKNGCNATFQDYKGAPVIEKCPVCGKGYLQRRKGKNGDFWSCSEYSNGCKAAFSDVKGKPVIKLCPECKKGYLQKRSGKNGDFYGCNNYPDCKATFESGKNGLPVLTKKGGK